MLGLSPAAIGRGEYLKKVGIKKRIKKQSKIENPITNLMQRRIYVKPNNRFKENIYI